MCIVMMRAKNDNNTRGLWSTIESYKKKKKRPYRDK